MRGIQTVVLLLLLLIPAACAVKSAPEEASVEVEPYRREILVVLGNLHRSVGGFARLEYLVSFSDDQGAAWFRRHKNDFAMVLLEALSIERFDGLDTPAGREAFSARMTELANQELKPQRATAELTAMKLR